MGPFRKNCYSISSNKPKKRLIAITGDPLKISQSNRASPEMGSAQFHANYDRQITRRDTALEDLGVRSRDSFYEPSSRPRHPVKFIPPPSGLT